MLIPEYKESEKNFVSSYRVYPSTLGMYEEFGFQMPDSEPVMDTPISPRENMLRALKGKTPYWMPFGGMSTADNLCFMPRQNPDNWVSHLIQDGGEEKPVFPSLTQHSSWFDPDWEFVPTAGGATVHPGNPKITDISEWEDVLKIPDLDAIDWKEVAEMNKQYLSETAKFRTLNILNGNWERLMSLMEVDNAAMAIVDEDQEEGLRRFLDAYTTFLCEYISRMAKACDFDAVLLHDDWGHQRSSFFSPALARDLFLPYLKRITACCHENGLYYEQHSCGRNENFIEMYIEAGVDIYCPQNINDFDYLLEKTQGTGLLIGVPQPELPFTATPEEVVKAATEYFEHYKKYHCMTSYLFPNPLFNMVLYELSRKEYGGREA